jgi:hypothetical protein
MKRKKKQSKAKVKLMKKTDKKYDFFPNNGITDPTYYINQNSLKKLQKNNDKNPTMINLTECLHHYYVLIHWEETQYFFYNV